MIEPKVQRVVQDEVHSDERLIWIGKPVGFPVCPYGLASLAFSFSTCIALFICSVIGIELDKLFNNSVENGYSLTTFLNSETKFAYFVIGFALLALFLILAAVKRVLSPYFQIYALTNRRAIIFDRFLSRRVVSFYPVELSKIERVGNDRIGTLGFGSFNVQDFFAWWKIVLNKFHKISDPRSVETMIRTQILK